MQSLAGKRVLIVEDQYFIADDLRAAVEAAGGMVLGPFAYVGQAKEMVEQADAAILNVWAFDGLTYPLAEALRERGVPIVFATGQSPQTEPREWRTYYWISKPYRTSKAIATLTKALSPTEPLPDPAIAGRGHSLYI